MTKKILITIVVIVVLAVGVSVFINRNNLKLPRLFLTGGLTVPEYVSVFLGSSVENNERVPVLALRAYVGGGCDDASGLKTKASSSGARLVIDIEGYKIARGSGEVCPSVVSESRAKINIDASWLKQEGDKEIIFRLGGRENKYKVSYNQHLVTLSGIQVTNVVSNRCGYNPPDVPVTLEMAIYPMDVARVSLGGSVYSEKDYRMALHNFAQVKGFIPAEQIYPWLQQDRKSQLYVVIKNRPMPESNRVELLGYLPNEGVSVGLGAAIDEEYYCANS